MGRFDPTQPDLIERITQMNMRSIFLHDTQNIAIDFDSVETRLSLLELANFARVNQRGTATFVDSAGASHTLNAGEIQELTVTAHRQLHGGQ
jgi:hypothetical protein